MGDRCYENAPSDMANDIRKGDVRRPLRNPKAGNRSPIIVVGLHPAIVTLEESDSASSGEEHGQGSVDAAPRRGVTRTTLGVGASGTKTSEEQSGVPGHHSPSRVRARRLSAIGRDSGLSLEGRRRPRAERVEVPVFRCRLPLKRG